MSVSLTVPSRLFLKRSTAENPLTHKYQVDKAITAFGGHMVRLTAANQSPSKTHVCLWDRYNLQGGFDRPPFLQQICSTIKKKNVKRHIEIIMTYYQNVVRFLWVFVILIVSFSCAGCSSAKRPKDLPKLYSCTLTFNYENGEPITDALISVYSSDPAMKWMAGGRTDSRGKVKLMTSGQYPGIPEGKFNVIIAKTESIRDGKKMEESDTMTAEETSGVIQVYTFVEKKYAERKSTPLELTIVSSGKNDQSFQCGKPTRELLTTIIP